MIDHELTDPTGSALTITHNDDGAWITATQDRDEVTVGPFPARTLRASFDMGDDLADGGVTAAAIEAEVVSPERARSLVQEREEARAGSRYWFERFERAEENVRVREEMINRLADRAEKAEHFRDQYREDAIRAEQQRDSLADIVATTARQRDEADKRAARPLTADDITDEYAARVVDLLRSRGHGMLPAHHMRSVLEAAVEVPRPEGAEQIEAEVAEYLQAHAGYSAAELADWLAERGVRAGGES